MTVKVHCVTFPEVVLETVGDDKFQDDIEILQFLRVMHIRLSSHRVRSKMEVPFLQWCECRAPVEGIHFGGPFQKVPWAHHFLNFWAGSRVWDSAKQTMDDDIRDLRVGILNPNP